MKSETLTKAVKKQKIQTAPSSVSVSTSGELITDVQEEETEEMGSLLERILNMPVAAKSKKEEDFDDDDDDEDFDDEEDFDDDDEDFDEEEISDEDFEEFDMPKSKPGTAGAKKKEDDDFELEEDFDDFDDFDDDDDDDF